MSYAVIIAKEFKVREDDVANMIGWGGAGHTFYVNFDNWARSTANALFSIHFVTFNKCMHALFTSACTSAAPEAFCLIEKHLAFAVLCFGVMAPQTMQGATLQKHRRADARSVVCAISLNIQYRSHIKYYAPCEG